MAAASDRALTDDLANGCVIYSLRVNKRGDSKRRKPATNCTECLPKGYSKQAWRKAIRRTPDFASPDVPEPQIPQIVEKFDVFALNFAGDELSAELGQSPGTRSGRLALVAKDTARILVSATRGHSR
jgi:hypothetical protein